MWEIPEKGGAHMSRGRWFRGCKLVLLLAILPVIVSYGAPVARASGPLAPLGAATVVGSVILDSRNASYLVVNPNTDRVYFNSGVSNADGVVIVVNASDKTNPSVVTTLTAYNHWGLTVNPSTNRFYSTDGYGGNIVVYNGATNGVITTVQKGYCHARMDTDATTNLIYVVSQCGANNDPLHVLNGATNALVAGPLGTAGVVWGVNVNPATGRAYVNSSGKTRVFGPSPAFSFLTDLPNTSILAVNPVTNRLYFVSGADLQVRDGSNESLLATIAGAGGFVGGAAVNTSRNRLYVSDPTNKVVKIIDGATNTVVGTFALPGNATPYQIAVDSTKDRVYVVGSSSPNTLYVVEELAPAPPVPGLTPWGLAALAGALAVLVLLLGARSRVRRRGGSLP